LPLTAGDESLTVEDSSSETEGAAEIAESIEPELAPEEEETETPADVNPE